MDQLVKKLLKRSMKSSFPMEVSSLWKHLELKNAIADATTYAHHVFKAFDIESTGSINFRVLIISVTSKKILCKGYVSFLINPSPWNTEGKTGLDFSGLRLEW